MNWGIIIGIVIFVIFIIVVVILVLYFERRKLLTLTTSGGNTPGPNPTPGLRPDFAQCTNYAQCQSNNCQLTNNPNIGFCVRFCSSDSNCSPNSCNNIVVQGDVSTLACCPNSDDIYSGSQLRYYCTGLPSGSLCTVDGMCTSGNCAGNQSDLNFGVCA